MLKCDKCGTELNGYEQFCNNCGNVVVIKENNEDKDIIDSDSVLVRNMKDDNLEVKYRKVNDTKKKALSIKIYLAFLIPVILVSAVIILITKEKVNTIGNRFNNRTIGGSIAQQGKWIYCNVANDGIYRISIKDGKAEKVIDGVYYGNLNVVGDYIYCHGVMDNIYKIGIKDKSVTAILNKEKLKLEDEDGIVNYIYMEVVTDKEIYFTAFTGDSKGLYRMELEGGAITKLMDGYCPIFYVDKKYIYTLSVSEDSGIIDYKEYKINRLKRDGSDIKILYDEKVAHLNRVFKDEDYLYLLEGNSKLYQYNFKNKETKVVFENDEIVNLDVKDGWIYYTMDDSEIHRRKIGTNKTEKLSGGNAGNYFYLFDDYIVYTINDKGNLVIAKTDGSDKVQLKSLGIE